MQLRETIECPNCKRLASQVARQEAEIADLKAQLAAALERIAQLEHQLAAARKNSSTSSKPPSSDIVKPKKPLGKGGKKRKRGGQPGHKRHEVREALRELFAVIHRREKLSEAAFARKMQAAREEVFRVATTRVPQGKYAQKLAKRFHKHGEAYFQFITTPGVDPTNNLAEQAIRFVVIDRRVTQGTRSETGRRWCERIWTTIATCSQQGRSVFAFLLESVDSHLRGVPPPSLLPSGT